MKELNFQAGQNRLYVIPSLEPEREFLLSVDREAKSMVQQKINLFSEMDWEINTIAFCTLQALTEVLYLYIIGSSTDLFGILDEDEDHNPYVNFCNILRISPSFRENMRAEKNGSFNAVYRPGTRVNDIIGDDNPRGKKYEKVDLSTYYLTDDEKKNKAWEKFDRMIRIQRLPEMYGISLSSEFAAIGITDCWLESLYRRSIEHILMTGESGEGINANDMFELQIHAFPTHNGSTDIRISFTPGVRGKLSIKSDLRSEADEED